MTAQTYSPAFSRLDQGPIAKWFWTVDRGLLGAGHIATLFVVLHDDRTLGVNPLKHHGLSFVR